MQVKAEIIHFEAKESHSPRYLAAKEICRVLQNKGFQAYIVGGYVRQFFLCDEDSSHSCDIDISTSAHGMDIKKVFKNSVCVNEKLFVYLIEMSGFKFELTSFRTESTYKDGRRPSHVEHGSMEEDSLRRDFTINAMYFDPTTNLIYDFHKGIADVKNNLLRCVGNPSERFNEDYLRIIRLFRFSINLNFQIEKETLNAAIKNKSKILDISKERILIEIQKISKSKVFTFFKTLQKELNFFKLFFQIEFIEDKTQPFSFCYDEMLRNYPCLGMFFVIFLQTDEGIYLNRELQKNLLLWPIKREEKRLLTFTQNILKTFLKKEKLSKTELDFNIFTAIYKTETSLLNIDTVINILIEKFKIDTFTPKKIKKIRTSKMTLKEYIHLNLPKETLEERKHVSLLENKSKANYYLQKYYRDFKD